MIRYLKYNQIDKLKWDRCISGSQNRLVYCLSWYLDIVSPEWQALVEDDYIAVMPLPARKKYCIPYLTQPHYLQQLGIFAPTLLEEKNIEVFLKKIPPKFLYANFHLNSANCIKNLKYISLRDNFELKLNKSFPELQKAYNKDYNARKLKIAGNFNLLLTVNDRVEDFLTAYIKESKIKQSDLAVHHLREIINCALSRNNGEVYLVRNSLNEVLAGAFFLTGFNKLIYLVSFSSEEGRRTASMFYLMDKVIEKYAQQNWILDFEGSMIPGIAKFMKGWGAELVRYPKYYRNHIKFLHSPR